MKVHLLDIWALPNDTSKLVIRVPGEFNDFALVSLGTGESSAPMTGGWLHQYLAGRNPFNTPYTCLGNIAEEGHAKIIVPENDI